MIRRILALFALLTLALVSAAPAHEHAMSHSASSSTEATPVASTAGATATRGTDHMVVWLATSGASTCPDVRDAGHNHSKLADCTCPAACAGLFNVAAAALPLSAGGSTDAPSGARRLFARSAAPPTPPPRA